VSEDPEKLPEAGHSILENVSEIKKRGRGRPAEHPRELYEACAKGRAQTRRGKQNYIYMAHAMTGFAAEKERYSYLFTPKYRTTILAEIGRLSHPRLMASVAGEICATRMKTAKAVGLCRRMRGKGSPDASTLAKKIKRTIQDYRDRHPNLSEADVATALIMVA